MDIGKEIKALRKVYDWTQQELADKMDVARATIASYETNKREPDAKTLVKLAGVFDISVDELLGRE